MRYEARGTVARRAISTPIAMGASLLALMWVMTRAPGISPLAVVSGAVLLAVAAVALTLRLPLKKGTEQKTIVADERGLVVDGAVAVPRGSVRAAYPVRVGEGHALRVEAGLFRASLVHLASLEDAEGLAEVLAAAEADGIMRVRALPPWARHVRTISLLLTTSPWLLFNVVRWLPAWSMALIVAMYGLVALPLVLPQQVEIGRDGVLLRWLSKRRFIPFTAITEVHETPLGFAMTLEGERTVEVRLTQRDKAASARTKSILKRIESRREALAELSPGEEQSLLSRGERELDAWLRDVRSLGEPSAHGYRAIAVPRERLWAVLENPAADPSAREGAAVALHASIDEAERERLTAVGRATASPRLRVALDAVAKAPDAERLRVAYESVEAEAEADASIPEMKASAKKS